MKEPLEKCYWQARDFARRQQMVDADFLEKYAELIVRECMEVVGDCSVEYATRPQIIEEIKEHFGVEE